MHWVCARSVRLHSTSEQEVEIDYLDDQTLFLCEASLTHNRWPKFLPPGFISFFIVFLFLIYSLIIEVGCHTNVYCIDAAMPSLGGEYRNSSLNISYLSKMIWDLDVSYNDVFESTVQ